MCKPLRNKSHKELLMEIWISVKGLPDNPSKEELAELIAKLLDERDKEYKSAIEFYMRYKDDYSGLLKKEHPEVYKEFEKFVEKLNKEQFSKKGAYIPPDGISLDAYDWFLKYCFSLNHRK